jgi:hypothetical protein
MNSTELGLQVVCEHLNLGKKTLRAVSKTFRDTFPITCVRGPLCDELLEFVLKKPTVHSAILCCTEDAIHMDDIHWDNAFRTKFLLHGYVNSPTAVKTLTFEEVSDDWEFRGVTWKWKSSKPNSTRENVIFMLMRLFPSLTSLFVKCNDSGIFDPLSNFAKWMRKHKRVWRTTSLETLSIEQHFEQNYFRDVFHFKNLVSLTLTASDLSESDKDGHEDFLNAGAFDSDGLDINLLGSLTTLKHLSLKFIMIKSELQTTPPPAWANSLQSLSILWAPQPLSLFRALADVDLKKIEHVCIRQCTVFVSSGFDNQEQTYCLRDERYPNVWEDGNLLAIQAIEKACAHRWSSEPKEVVLEFSP